MSSFKMEFIQNNKIFSKKSENFITKKKSFLQLKTNKNTIMNSIITQPNNNKNIQQPIYRPCSSCGGAK